MRDKININIKNNKNKIKNNINIIHFVHLYRKIKCINI